MDSQRTDIHKPSFWIACAMVLTLLALSAWSVAFYCGLDAQTPDEEDWRDAAIAIAAKAADEDRVAIVPFWATQSEKHFVQAGLSPVYVRYVSKEDWPATPVLWIVEAYGRFSDRERWLARGARMEERFEVGPLTIERYTLPWGNEAVFDFREHLHEATVGKSVRGEIISCGSWDAKAERFHCDRRRDWHYVGRIVQEIGDAVRPTIWSHPVRNQQLQIAFYRVEAKRKIAIHHGLTLYAAADKGGKPVFMDVIVDGRKIKTIEHPNMPGWLIDTIDISMLEGDIHDITISIRTPFDGRRHFSWSGYAL